MTGFTVGHTLTLGLATFQVVQPPAGWVEAGIAASIVWVGVENLLCLKRKRRDVRPALAALFGLIG